MNSLNSSDWRRLSALLGLALTLCAPALAKPAKRPKLVVFMVVDQLRADALVRYSSDLLPARLPNGQVGGLKFLNEQGLNCHQFFLEGLPTHTAVGHACLSTGADPGVHGIVGNWWYETQTGRYRESVDDDQDQVSPRLMQTSTLGDELKLATQGKSKVYGVAVKSRAAVLLTGHGADGAYWLDAEANGWTTSKYYLNQQSESQKKWLNDFRKNGWLESHLKWIWHPLLPAAAYKKSNASRVGQIFGPSMEWRVEDLPALDAEQSSVEAPLTGKGSGKPHAVDRIAASPLGTTWTFDLATKLLDHQQLGQDDNPDLLCLSFSSYDKVGHACGPYSPQLQDMLVRFDRDCSQFLNFLQQNVGLENVLVVLTADHGVAPIPEQKSLSKAPQVFGQDCLRDFTSDAVTRIDAALTEKFGPPPAVAPLPSRARSKTAGNYVLNFTDPHLVLDHSRLNPQQLIQAQAIAADILSREPSVQLAWSASDIQAGRLPRIPLAEQVSRSYFAGRTGDVFVFQKPFWIYSFKEHVGTNHGAPWTYDSHIPLILCGSAFEPGISTRQYHPRDLVATLSELLRVTPPAACFGRVFSELPPRR